MVNVNDFKVGMTIQYDGNIYTVLDFQHVKPGKGAAFVKMKLKNLRTYNQSNVMPFHFRLISSTSALSSFSLYE